MILVFSIVRSCDSESECARASVSEVLKCKNPAGPAGQTRTLPAAGLHIVGAGLLLLHSHTESAQSLPLASEFLETRRFLPPGCTSWVPGS